MWSSRRTSASTNLQHTNWSLMGERTWDALRCLDYVVTLPEVDPEPPGRGRAVAGRRDHHVCRRPRRAGQGRLQQRLADHRGQHEERPLPLLQLPRPGGELRFLRHLRLRRAADAGVRVGRTGKGARRFSRVPIGRQALEEIRAAYRVFNAESNVTLTVHPGRMCSTAGTSAEAARWGNRRPIPDDGARPGCVSRRPGGPRRHPSLAGRTICIDLRAPQPGCAGAGWGASRMREAALINGQPCRCTAVIGVSLDPGADPRA